ncbi:hypothetical protein [Halostagnicola kamekurae]|uniref:Uncharacterized protein n=1 Tax=Halostagnicola kamekurae TaxID=619731 RepID=A0A1I6SS56_9EURY|nr:hypothetical protein [Halostagnicola kamekurae]SFS79698.1 hypothetical protein SAMN04488556_2871 [Halostagnicola kamekurae]
MSTRSLPDEIPRAVPLGITVLFVVSLVFTVISRVSPLLFMAFWGGLLSIGFYTAITYLLYRLVLAVERIADSQ